MKIIGKIVETILNIIILIIIFALIIAGTYSFQTKIQKKEYANLFGYTAFEVATGSMQPSINIGDVVIVKINDTYSIDDIIVFKEDNSFITHRVIDIKENTVITKGDSNNATDKEISKEDVLGKVIKIVPNVSIIRKTLGTPIVIISISITIVLFGFVFSYKGKEEEKENKDGKKSKAKNKDKNENKKDIIETKDRTDRKIDKGVDNVK